MKVKSIVILLLITLCFCFLVACAPTESSTGDGTQDGAQINIIVGSQTFSATLADNATAKAFLNLLPLTLNMSDINGNEKYNYLSDSLPTDTYTPGTIHEGDLMLYGASCVVLFYETFSSSFSYTRIGHVNDTNGLKSALGTGSVTVTFEASNKEDNDSEQPNQPEQPSQPEQSEKPEQPSETTSLMFKQEGQSYTVIDMTGEETTVVIPSRHNGLPVTKIQGEYGTGVFARKAITSVTIPDSIVEIGQNSFNNCKELVTVNISESSKLTTIGNNAFSGNSSLREIYLPVGMTNLGSSVFNNCGAIERFIVADGNQAYSSENGHLIERATDTLIRGANNKEIPNGVGIIASAAFRKSIISQLVIPASVESIENYIIQDSAIEEIVYQGTEAQWAEITKAKLWNIGKTDIAIKFASSQEEETKMYITINGIKAEVTLEKNSSVTALVELLKQGDVTYTADDYGGFEKVGSLGHTLPTNHTQLTTEPGDIVLYQTNQIVLFYGSNSWSYTRLGKISYSSLSELKSLLKAGQGSIEVKISLK